MKNSIPFFNALSDPTRRRMLRLLAEGERTIGDLTLFLTYSRLPNRKEMVSVASGCIHIWAYWKTA